MSATQQIFLSGPYSKLNRTSPHPISSEWPWDCRLSDYFIVIYYVLLMHNWLFTKGQNDKNLPSRVNANSHDYGLVERWPRITYLAVTVFSMRLVRISKASSHILKTFCCFLGSLQTKVEISHRWRHGRYFVTFSSSSISSTLTIPHHIRSYWWGRQISHKKRNLHKHFVHHKSCPGT